MLAFFVFLYSRYSDNCNYNWCSRRISNNRH